MGNNVMTMEDPLERRKHKRFLVQEGAFVELRDHRGKIGEIIDVSKGGLAFRYIDIGDRPKESLELDIFLKHAGFRVENLPAETVSDVEITKTIHQSITIMRRHGVKFGKLTKSQKSRLEYFIRHFTTDETSTQKERVSLPKVAYQ
jgi:hypothetical protein